MSDYLGMERTLGSIMIISHYVQVARVESVADRLHPRARGGSRGWRSNGMAAGCRFPAEAARPCPRAGDMNGRSNGSRCEGRSRVGSLRNDPLATITPGNTVTCRPVPGVLPRSSTCFLAA